MNTEERLQHDIVMTFNMLRPNYRACLFHIDNNSSNIITGSRKKSLGVVPGVSDLVLLPPSGKIVLIELKTETGALSKHQRWFRDIVVSLGYRYEVIRSVQEFVKLLNEVWEIKKS